MKTYILTSNPSRRIEPKDQTRAGIKAALDAVENQYPDAEIRICESLPGTLVCVTPKSYRASQ